MRIALVRPGKMPIPPRGWGAVEIVVHEIAVRLQQRGHKVLVVNGRNEDRIIQRVNAFRPDFVHLHFDRYHAVLAQADCPNKAFTSHSPFHERGTAEHADETALLHPVAAAADVHIFALSDREAAAYVRLRAAPGRVHVIPNGVDIQAFRFEPRARLADRSICLGRINPRKRQVQLQTYDCEIDFVGPVRRRRKHWLRRLQFWKPKGFDADAPSYLGEWTRDEVRERLTEYANMVLLSKAEAHSLACMEALAAGLGLVISAQATAHLDLSKPFIDVIPEHKIDDRDHVRATVRANRAKSAAMRAEIRAYARQFDWDRMIDRYCATVAAICEGKGVVGAANELPVA